MSFVDTKHRRSEHESSRHQISFGDPIVSSSKIINCEDTIQEFLVLPSFFVLFYREWNLARESATIVQFLHIQQCDCR